MIKFFRSIIFIGIAFCISGCGLPRAILVGPNPLIEEKTIVVPQQKNNNPSLNGKIAVNSILQVRCISNGNVGTGFLHKSSLVITAYHVIKDCPIEDIRVGPPDDTFNVKKSTYSKSTDLACLVPNKDFTGTSVFKISKENILTYGEQITSWGFPEGYSGKQPLLTVGYISGFQQLPDSNNGGTNSVWYINAAISDGMSGSPVIRMEDGTVMGIVSGKQQTGAPEIQHAIKLLNSPTNKKDQALANALEAFRQRTQYNIGYVIPGNTVRSFISECGVEP